PSCPGTVDRSASSSPSARWSRCRTGPSSCRPALVTSSPTTSPASGRVWPATGSNSKEAAVRLSEVTGHPVVTTDAAEQVARVGNAIIDPAAHRVLGFKIGGNAVLPLDQIQGIGSDAVTIAGRDAIRLPANDAEIRWIDDGLDLTDRAVLSDEGNAMSHVEDIEFDPRTGR